MKLLNNRLEVRLRNRKVESATELIVSEQMQKSLPRLLDPITIPHLSQAMFRNCCLNAASQGKRLWWQGLGARPTLVE